MYDQHGIKLSLDHPMRTNPISWHQALSNEFGRLAQSNDAGVICTGGMNFIRHSLLPPNTKVTYTCFVCNHRPLKSEKWRVHLVVGGYELSCTYDTGSPAANLLKTKILLNSFMSYSDKGTPFMILDLKDHLFASPMQTPKYMKIPQKYFLPNFINKYNLDSKFHMRCIYCKITKGMYCVIGRCKS